MFGFFYKKIIRLASDRSVSTNKGMTALELVVVMGIFAAISSTVLFNYRNFSNNVSLQNLAQDIALQIKRAQTDAVSGSLPVFPPGSIQSTPLDWKPSYGIAFQTDTQNGWDLAGKGFVYYFNKNSVLDPNVIEIDRDFWDTTESTYEGCFGLGAESECLEEIRITSGDVIDMICFDFEYVGLSCDGVLGTQAFISFTRPRGNPIILDGAQDDGGVSPHNNVFLKITSPSGSHKYVSIWSSGYINIR